MTAGKSTTPKTPGPKPRFQVVENTLKCQTENGELSLSLKVKFGTIRQLAKVSSSGDRFAEFDFLMEHIFTEEQNACLDELDSSDAAAILVEFSNALADRLKASLGESKRSSTS